MGNIVRQPDTYHAIAHQFGHWISTLEKAAYKTIEKEFDRKSKLETAKSESQINKINLQYISAKSSDYKKIELYEIYSYLYNAIRKQLRIFDNNGNLRDRKEAEANVNAGLDLIETLEIPGLTKAVNKTRRILHDLFNYFETAIPILEGLKGLPINNEALQALCLASQAQKESTKSKKAKKRHYWLNLEQFYLKVSVDYLHDDYQYIKNLVYIELGKIIQSSSLAECINSIIRPYLDNSKNHVTQGMLNLIKFYHNHRRYIAGKRKGKTPNEILTGKKQEKDWIELLFDLAREKDSNFSMSTI